MSTFHPTERRIVVWVQNFGDRPKLMLQWHDPETGKRKSQSAGTCNPLDAEKARADLEYELNHGMHKRAASMSWERFRELFEEEFVAHRRQNTRENYHSTLDLFERVCAPTSLRSVKERAVSAFAAGLRQLPGRGGLMRDSSIKLRLGCLRAALRWAAQQKLIPECPGFPAIKPPRKRPQPVPTESFERLLARAAGDAHMSAFLLCGWLAGLRLNEALALEREQTDKAPYLDPDRDRIVFPAEIVKAAEDQWVPLDPRLWEALDALPLTGRKVFRFESSDRRGERELTDITVSARVRNLAQAAGVRLTYKSLRRGFGCRYAGRVPAQVLQKLMRHASIRTTMEYYANVDDAAMEAVLGKDRSRNSSRNRGAARGDGPAAADGTSGGRDGASG
jgi:integrase